MTELQQERSDLSEAGSIARPLCQDRMILEKPLERVATVRRAQILQVALYEFLDDVAPTRRRLEEVKCVPRGFGIPRTFLYRSGGVNARAMGEWRPKAAFDIEHMFDYHDLPCLFRPPRSPAVTP